MRKFLLLIVTTFLCSSAFAQTWKDTVAMIEKTVSPYLSQNPGCQLSVSRKGKLIFSKAWGMADLERNVALSLTSVIEAGSVSKQFTAASILLLEQQGKLSLEDDVRKYIPELPDYGNVMKIRHLMHHTSGLRDWGSVAALTGWPRSTKTYSNDDALEIICQQKKLNNKPGDEYIYSNSNFNLQAIIVQRVSGMSLAEFSKKYIFAPAGMIHTQWRDNYNRIVPNRAIAYQKTAAGFEADMPNENVYGNGGLLTTTEDLLKWTDYFLHGKLGSPSLLAKQITPEAFNNGLMNNYAAGLVIEKFRGWDMIDHTGSTASYRAYLENFPQLDLSIAFLSNSSQFDTARVDFSRTIKNIFVKNIAKETAVRETPISLSKEKLTALAGLYRNDRSGENITLAMKDEKLTLDDNATLIPVKENVLMSGANQLIIQSNKTLMWVITGRDTVTYTRVDPAASSATSYQEFPGKYFSEETMSGVSVNLKDNSLYIHLKPGMDFKLSPEYKDAFSIEKFGGILWFEKDTANSVTGMYISISRARNVRFTKMK